MVRGHGAPHSGLIGVGDRRGVEGARGGGGEGAAGAAEEGPAPSSMMKHVHPWCGQYEVTSLGVLTELG